MSEDRVRRNIRRMIDQGATEDEIDVYIQSEGLPLESIKKPRDDAVVSGAKGLMRGALSGVGTILDAPQNLYQLGKAAVGTAIGMSGGDPPALGETNTASRALNRTVGRFANLAPNNPSGYGQFAGTAGELAGAGMVSGTPFNPSSVGLNVVVPAVGGAVGEQIGGEAGKFVGSIAAPVGVVAAKQGASRLLNRDRVNTLTEAGVGPTLADTSNAGAFVQKTFGYLPTGAFFNAAGIRRQAKELEDAVEMLIPRSGVTPDVAGEIVKEGLDSWKGRFMGNYKALRERTAQVLPPETPAVPNRYMMALEELTTPNPVAPSSTAAIIPQDFRRRLENLRSDVSQGPLNISALKQIKEEIGSVAFPKYGMVVDQNQGQYIKLYKALSDDLLDAAKAQDLRVDPTGKVRTAQLAQKTENAYYAAGQQRIKDYYNKIYRKADPEKLFNALLSDNGELVRLTTKALTKDERDVVASAAIEWLGKTKPGVRTMENQFSPETFMTQWNVLSDKTKRALFSGGSNQNLHSDLDKIASAASILRETRQVMPNPSGSGLAVSSASTVAAGAGGYFLNPIFYGPIAVGGASSYLMSNPRFIRWLSQGVDLNPRDFQSHIVRLGNMATMSKDAEFKENVEAYINAKEQNGN